MGPCKKCGKWGWNCECQMLRDLLSKERKRSDRKRPTATVQPMKEDK
jgi:hypothetical protein